MPFTLLNSAQLKTVEKVKLQSFNPQTIHMLQEANDFEDKICLLSLCLSGKSTTQHKKSITKAIKKNQINLFKSNLQQYREDCKLIEEQAAYEKKRDELSTFNWNVSIQRNIRGRYEKLYKFWLRNKDTSHYTSKSIYTSCNITLPLFENFLHFAQEELAYHKKKIAKVDFNLLQNYLHVLHNEIISRKTIMCDAMISRLEVAAKVNDLSEDDVTNYIVNELQAIGVVSRFTQRRSKGLTPELFSYFNHFVCAKGNTEQFHRLKKLPWFTDTEHFYSQKIDDELVVIPKKMRKFKVPTTTKFSFFNIWSTWKAKYLKQHSFLLIQLRSMEQPNYLKPMTLLQLLDKNNWQEMTKLEKEVATEIENANNFGSSFFNRLFFSSKANFLKEWSKVLLLHLQRIRQIKLHYALQLSRELETRLTFQLDTTVIHSAQMQDVLRMICKEVEQMPITASQENQWLQIKKIFESIFNEGNKLNIANPPDSMQEILSKIEIGSCKQSLHKERTIVAQLKCLMLHKDTILQMSVPALKAHLTKIEQLLKSPQESERLEVFKFWVSFFSRYLDMCLAIKVSNQHLELVENFLIKFSPKCIQRRILTLKQEQKSKTRFLYETRCRALLFTFANMDNEEQNQNTNFVATLS